jgi:hypothetical protein
MHAVKNELYTWLTNRAPGQSNQIQCKPTPDIMDCVIAQHCALMYHVMWMGRAAANNSSCFNLALIKPSYAGACIAMTWRCHCAETQTQVLQMI